MYHFMVLQLTQETELHPTRFAGKALIQMHIHMFVKPGRQRKQLIANTAHHWFVFSFVMFV